MSQRDMYQIMIDNDEGAFKNFYRIFDGAEDANKFLAQFPNRSMVNTDEQSIMYAIGRGSNGNAKVLTVTKIRGV